MFYLTNELYSIRRLVVWLTHLGPSTAKPASKKGCRSSLHGVSSERTGNLKQCLCEKMRYDTSDSPEQRLPNQLVPLRDQVIEAQWLEGCRCVGSTQTKRQSAWFAQIKCQRGFSREPVRTDLVDPPLARIEKVLAQGVALEPTSQRNRSTRSICPKGAVRSNLPGHSFFVA